MKKIVDKNHKLDELDEVSIDSSNDLKFYTMNRHENLGEFNPSDVFRYCLYGIEVWHGSHVA